MTFEERTDSAGDQHTATVYKLDTTTDNTAIERQCRLNFDESRHAKKT